MKTAAIAPTFLATINALLEPIVLEAVDQPWPESGSYCALKAALNVCRLTYAIEDHVCNHARTQLRPHQVFNIHASGD